MVRVKICGITRVEDARLCVEAGVHALGFIFVEKTPRFVTAAQARAIIATLPPFVTPVGIFWDHAPGHVKAVAEECGLAALQFHGDEAPTAFIGNAKPLCAHLGEPAVKLDQMLKWIAHWVAQGGRNLGRPTHFEVRDGKY